MQSVAQDSLRSRSENNEASAVGQHQADAGSDAYEKDFALSLLSQEQDALYEIEEALKRHRRRHLRRLRDVGQVRSRTRGLKPSPLPALLLSASSSSKKKTGAAAAGIPPRSSWIPPKPSPMRKKNRRMTTTRKKRKTRTRLCLPPPNPCGPAAVPCARSPKRRIDINVEAIDFKNTELLKKFLTEKGRILPAPHHRHDGEDAPQAHPGNQARAQRAAR